LYAFLETMVDKATKELAIKRDDELVKATMLTDGGKVVHPNFAKAVEAPRTEPAAIPATTIVADASEKPVARKTTAKKSAAKPKGTA
ncbi:NAD(P)(+) transhydrogenase (Re/Si-specific) subunit alpha, partial [Mesorhizobium sp. M3A.F.Ca.ET.201.01.1.1]